MTKKTLFSTISLILILITSMTLQAQQKINRYLVKSAVITYQHSGMSEGEEIVYIDNYGEKEARYTDVTVSVMGMTSKSKELNLTLDDAIYSINLLNNKGTKMTNPAARMDEKEMHEWNEWGEELMSEMGFEKTGQATILGKKCDVWEGMGIKTWIWKNLALKTESSIVGNATIEAVKLETDISIPASKFKLPEGVKIDEVESGGEDVSPEDMEDLKESLNQLKGLLGTKKK